MQNNYFDAQVKYNWKTNKIILVQVQNSTVMNLPNVTWDGKLTYLGHDPLEVTMSILTLDPSTQSRGCDKRDNNIKSCNDQNIVLHKNTQESQN